MKAAITNLLGTLLFIGALVVLSVLIAAGWATDDEE